MSHESGLDRRRFLALSAAAAPLLPAAIAVAEEEKGEQDWEICTFTKPLQHLSYDETSEVIADIGFQGVESAVRPGGHVEPGKVEEDLPAMMDSLRKHELNLTVMTTAITEVGDEQHTETVLRTAAALGVRRFRMGYYRYDLKQPIAPQLAEFGARMDDLVALCREIGIKPVYQNHSGDRYCGGPVWDMLRLMEKQDPALVGFAFDIGHATVEGFKAWPLNFAAARPFIDTVYVKEPYWKDNQLSWGPVGGGGIDRKFYRTLVESGFDGPISLHIEYLGHKDPKIVPEVIKAMRSNLATLRELLS